MDFTDQNVLLVKKIYTFLSVKSIIFIRCIRDVRHFKAVVLPFLKCTITFLYPKYFRSYRHLNDEQCKYASPMNEFSENDTLYSSCLICMLYYFFRNFLCWLSNGPVWFVITTLQNLDIFKIDGVISVSKMSLKKKHPV